MITNDDALSLLRAACAKEKNTSEWARKNDLEPLDVLRILRGDRPVQKRLMLVLGYEPVKAWKKINE